MSQSRVWLTEVLLIQAGLLCAVLPIPAAGQSAKQPFELSWTARSRRNCQIVQSLGEIALTEKPTIWAIGYYFPTEGHGAGDNSVVRSVDTGRHWVEISKSRMHAS